MPGVEGESATLGFLGKVRQRLAALPGGRALRLPANEAALWLAAFLRGSQLLFSQDLFNLWPPFVTMFCRNVMSALLTLPLLLGDRPQRRRVGQAMALASCSFLGSSLQMLALQRASVARVAFAGQAVLLAVPLLGRLLFGQPLRSGTLLALPAMAVGLLLLGRTEVGGGLAGGEAWAVLSALPFALHILLLGRFSRGAGVGSLLCLQAVAVAGLDAAAAWARGEAWTALTTPPLLLPCASLVLANTAASWCQLRGQAGVTAARTVFIMGLQPVFAATLAWKLRGQQLSAAQWLGGAIVLVACLGADRPLSRPTKR